MVRLTPELLARAPERINPFGDRELILRGLAIPAIENTGAANDQFQSIDLSDNEITQLGGFALMKRARTLILHNNAISSVSVNIGRTLPFLHTLVLSENKIEFLAEFDRLAGLRYLDTLILTGNPVTQKPHYRLYAIYKIPSLQVLDYQRVRLKERRDAKKKFDSAVGQKFEETIKSAISSIARGQPQDQSVGEQKILPADALERRRAIEAAIREAKSMDEIERLQAMLDLGVVPVSSAVGDTHGQSSSNPEDATTSPAEKPAQVETTSETPKSAEAESTQKGDDGSTTKKRTASESKQQSSVASSRPKRTKKG